MNATYFFVIGLFVAAAAHAQDVPRFTISANGQEVVDAATGFTT
jgi:hypothetical protein